MAGEHRRQEALADVVGPTKKKNEAIARHPAIHIVSRDEESILLKKYMFLNLCLYCKKNRKQVYVPAPNDRYQSCALYVMTANSHCVTPVSLGVLIGYGMFKKKCSMFSLRNRTLRKAT